MGSYEIESLFKECENLDDAVYTPENFAILKYCSENYEYNYNINAFIEKVSAVQEDTTREKLIHRILPAASFKIRRCCNVAIARSVNTRC